MIQMLPTELSDMTTQHISLRGYSGKYTDLSRPASDTRHALSCSMQPSGFVSLGSAMADGSYLAGLLVAVTILTARLVLLLFACFACSQAIKNKLINTNGH